MCEKLGTDAECARMTPAQRVVLVVLAGFAGLLLLMWMWTTAERIPTPPVITPTAVPVSATPTATVIAAIPPGFRLAGVAVGGSTSYAAIEPPGGGTSLYRLNEEVPGLGKLMRIGGEKVVVRTKDGDLEMWVAPAPTPTFSPTRRLAPRITPTRAPSQLPLAASPSPGSSP